MRMVDISAKEEIRRVAEAVGRIELKGETIEAIRRGRVEKGDPLAAAMVAGIMAAKRTPELIPLCHPIPLSSVELDFKVGEGFIEARCTVKAEYKTGVEMEALTGATAALLTIWDMVKYLEKDEEGQYPSTRIKEIRVVEKRKG
ncbi:MAG: cyclic pyranopterin monophosphate synthase MoaC [Candidatus Bathyarchaeia archaeon]